MKEQLSILGFAGSRRQNSYNRALVKAALELVPDDANIRTPPGIAGGHRQGCCRSHPGFYRRGNRVPHRRSWPCPGVGK